MNSAVQALLRPQSLAIVGASPREGSFGANLLTSVRSLGYGGKVHLVNPRYDRILDEPCYPSVGAILGGVDCAAYAVADAHLAASLREAAAAGTKGAVLFGRAHGADPCGTPRTDLLRDIASRSGMAVCGANCMGFVNLTDNLQLTGMPFKGLPRPSGVALISHSGSTWSGLVGNQRGMGFDYAVSAGQELATTVVDYIRFFLEATDVRVIACVLETLRDPEGFREVADAARAKGVAIVVLKLGRSLAAQHFAISHSGALSGVDAAYDAVFHRHGVIRVFSLDELLDTSELLAIRRVMSAPGVALGTDSGGERQLIVDLAADIGLPFAELAPETLRQVEASLDPGMEAANPLDYWGDGGDAMAPVLTAMANDPATGIVVMATNLPPDRNFSELSAAAILKVAADTDKPVALMGNIATTMSPEITARLRAAGVAVLMGTVSGLSALGHLRRFKFQDLEVDGTEPLMFDTAMQAGLDVGRANLRSAEGFDLLAKAGIAAAAWEEITDSSQLQGFGARHGWPIVLKIDDPGIAHKSDLGGVFVGLQDADAAAAAWAQLRVRHSAAPIIAQEMAAGAEIILGMTRDPSFGPLVTIGMGGVFTEIFKDATCLLAPFNEAAARKALESLKGFPLLTGARGRAPADLGALCALISRFSAFVAGAPGELAEIEINPVLAGPQRALAVDCIARLNVREK